MKHKFTSAKPAAPDQIVQADGTIVDGRTLVDGPKWNQQHVIAGRVIAANAIALADDDLILATGGSAGISYTLLPNAADGTVVMVIKTDAGSGAVTILGTVNGQSNLALTDRWQCAWLRAQGGSWNILGLFSASSSSPSGSHFSGPGTGDIFGGTSLLDIDAADDGTLPLTIRNQNSVTGEGLGVRVDAESGDVFISNYDADGNTVNNIILRGVGNGGYVRFGPDPNNGISVSKLNSGISLVTLDGNVVANPTSGGGIGFPSVGGGFVQVKTANFSERFHVQLFPDADGTFLLDPLVLPVYANNAAAISGGLTAGKLYRTGGDPDPVCVVH